MYRSLARFRASLFLILFLACAVVLVPELPGQRRPKKGSTGKSATKKKSGDKNKPKKYDDVITKEFESIPGVFLVHRKDDKVYFEIPQEAYNKLMLWTIEVAKGPPGVSWGGRSLGNRVIRWERRKNTVYLWNVTFDKRAKGMAIQRAVNSANMDSIIAAFDVEAEGKDRSAVIDVSSLFLKDLSDFSIKRAVGSGTVDSKRSYIDQVKAFPTNIDVRSLITFRSGGGKGSAGSGGKSYTTLLHYSLVQLPDRPMMGRYFDPRVGYFTRSFEDYSGTRGWSENRKYIARFRLEKKNPEAKISEPVKPIVFYLSREIPEKWRPYMKKGVEDWQPAFEKAGFKNAIICKEAPSKREDPGWDPEDARLSVIRWVADPTMNAMGPHVHDPRSGEIISAHIIFWNDVVKLAQQWYFVQCGGADPRVKSLPLPEDIVGECLRYITCHEVGHTLGLRHNHRASQAFSISQLRDPKFTNKYGSVASIMSYGRFNYVAQPGDKVKRFIPVLGPYDVFAIQWGYTPIPEAKTADDEKSTLDKWAARQMKEPFLRFGGEDGPSRVDPTVLTENIGDDRIEATRLGIKNLDRVLPKLISGTTKLGEDFTLLEETYRTIFRHRQLWFSSVAKLVGGVREYRTLGRRGTESFQRVPRAKQEEAVEFLLKEAFHPDMKLLDPKIVNQFKYQGVADDLLGEQKGVLRTLLSKNRFARLFDAEVLYPKDHYPALKFLKDVQAGLWSELENPQPKVSPLRRALQRAYLDHMKRLIDPKQPAVIVSSSPRRRRFSGSSSSGESDLRAIGRATLKSLGDKIDTALAKTQHPITRVHLQDCRKEVTSILDPKTKS